MATVSTIEPTTAFEPQRLSQTQHDILNEKLKYMSKCRERFNTYKSYLENTQLDNNILLYLFYGLFGIVTSFFLTSIYIWIPVHDVITNPEYWYEIELQTTAILFVMAIFFIANCSEWMNIERIKTIGNLSLVTFALVAIYNTIWVTSYIIWTYGFEYQWPLPFVAYLTTYIAIFCGWMALFYCFPRAWRHDLVFNKRIKFFLLSISFNMSGGMTYQIILKCFIILPENYQWILVFSLPLIREAYLWMTLYLGKKTADGDANRLIVISTHYTNARHATILATIVGSYAPFVASIVLLAIDFILNIYTCLMIVRNTKKNGNLEKRVDLLQELAINELVEFVVPITYLLCFLAAYYGPNAKVIGNIGNDYWHYQKEDDVDHVVTNVLLFFIVDFMSAIICACILWCFCRISLVHVCACLCKEFGLVFALNMAIDFACVS